MHWNSKLSQEGKITWKSISIKLNFKRDLSSNVGTIFFFFLSRSYKIENAGKPQREVLKYHIKLRTFYYIAEKPLRKKTTNQTKKRATKPNKQNPQNQNKNPNKYTKKSSPIEKDSELLELHRNYVQMRKPENSSKWKVDLQWDGSNTNLKFKLLMKNHFQLLMKNHIQTTMSFGNSVQLQVRQSKGRRITQ